MFDSTGQLRYLHQLGSLYVSTFPASLPFPSSIPNGAIHKCLPRQFAIRRRLMSVLACGVEEALSWFGLRCVGSEFANVFYWQSICSPEVWPSHNAVIDEMLHAVIGSNAEERQASSQKNTLVDVLCARESLPRKRVGEG